MKQRILKLIAVLLFVAGNAMAQSLSVTDIDVYRKRESTIHVNISGAETITALQFNLSLPSGVTLAENEIHYGIAGYGCEMTTQPLENGDYLVVLYNMYQKTFRDGTLVIIPIVAGENGGTTTGSLYNVRMATTDAVSYKCENVSFNVTVTTPITGVTIDKETITLTEGETETLIATVSPAHAAYPTVTWTTSDASVATVDGGVVTAVKAGTATITATAGAYSAACSVTVTAPVVPEEEGLSTSKYYRIKNVSAQLYLQVNGNNSNMALQSKGDELTLSQIFSLEDAADGKFYIKSTTTDAKYYAHASGWNFNATTNADSKTSFTISLVDGEENVYTLYQDESIYTGLAGADATTAGTLIYCNKNVDQNGKWQFEALTADETNEYIAIFTAAAKPALEAAIANAESIVETRKAVLGASEIAAIEAVVATAKAQKDNTTDVDKLNALTDAINAAIGDAVYVWSLDDLNNTVCYAVSTESRGSWYSEAANLTGTDKAGVEINVTDENQQFAFLQSEGSGCYYLYSVGAKKFVSVSGSYTTLTDIPVETITFLEGKRTAKFPWVVALNSTDGEKQIGVSNGYTPAVITSYNDLTDAGNTVRFEKVAAFDATAALAVIEAYEASTAIEEVEIRNEKEEIYDLAGRKVVNPGKGIYIINGKKVLVK